MMTPKQLDHWAATEIMGWRLEHTVIPRLGVGGKPYFTKPTLCPPS